MVMCPNCHQTNRPGARFCGFCRTALTRSCPGCGRDNRIQSQFCAFCRAPLSQTCPVCGQTNRTTARFCQRCRAVLGSVVRPAAPLPPNPFVVAPTPSPQLSSPIISNVAHHATGMLPTQTLLNGRYFVLKKIGGGGMGAVYKATDVQQPGRVWAIKEMSLSGSPTPKERAEAIANFQNEAATLHQLNHPNLPTVEQIFQDQHDRHYMVMEFIDGKTLLEHLEANGGRPLAETKVLEWAAQLCDVLEYLHDQPTPIIYRDLKPENIMVVTATGCLKLIDFGIVRFYKAGKTKDTVAIGTVGYAPPEQSAGQTDARSDIYAMAATLHHLLTGRDPKGETPWVYPPVRQLNPAISTKVQAALSQALETDRSKRPQNMAAFRNLLGVKSGQFQPASKAIPSASLSPQGRAQSPVRVSPRKLDFGTVSRGLQPTQKLQVVGGPILATSASATRAWLKVSPNPMKGTTTNIDVTVDTEQLPLGRTDLEVPDLMPRYWHAIAPAVRRFWWAMLIGLAIPYLNLAVIVLFGILAVLTLVQGLMWWTLLHASRLVQQPRRHTAEVEVQTGGNTEVIDVEIEVTPDPVENRWRWAAAVGLVIGEAALAWWFLSVML